MLDELERYFGGDGYYNWGVELLRKLDGDVRDYEKYCKASFTPREVEKRLNVTLKSHLEHLQAKKPVLSSNMLVETNKPTPSVQKPQATELDPEPPIISQLRLEEEQCRNDRRALHLTLEATENDAERSEKIFHIRALSDRINEIWAITDAFEIDGTLPALGSVATEKTAAEEAVGLVLRKQSIESRLCVLKRLLVKELGITKETRYRIEQRDKTAELTAILAKLSTIKSAKNAD